MLISAFNDDVFWGEDVSYGVSKISWVKKTLGCKLVTVIIQMFASIMVDLLKKEYSENLPLTNSAKVCLFHPKAEIKADCRLGV